MEGVIEYDGYDEVSSLMGGKELGKLLKLDEIVYNEFVNNWDEMLFESEQLLTQYEETTIDKKYESILVDLADEKGGTLTYKIQNDVLKAYVNRTLRGFKIDEEVHSIIVNFDFHPLESEINFNHMWLEFQNESDKLICKLYRSVFNKSNYILKFYELDYDYQFYRAKIRKAEIKATDPYNDVAFATKLRSEFKNLATNKDKLRGFSAEEVKAIEQAAKGGKIENALRAFGQGGAGDRFSATGAIAGGGLSSLAFGPEFGNAIAGPIGAIIGAKTMPALKGASRSAAGALGRQNLQNVMDLVKTGGNPYSGVQLAPFFKLNPITGTTIPANALNAAGLLAPYITNPDDLKSLLGQ